MSFRRVYASAWRARADAAARSSVWIRTRPKSTPKRDSMLARVAAESGRPGVPSALSTRSAVVSGREPRGSPQVSQARATIPGAPGVTAYLEEASEPAGAASRASAAVAARSASRSSGWSAVEMANVERAFRLQQHAERLVRSRSAERGIRPANVAIRVFGGV